MSKKRAIIFDFDGVFVEDRSSWNIIHEHFGKESNPEKNLAEYCEGRINYGEFMRKDIAEWPRGLHISEIEKILLDNCKIMKGAKETVAELKKKGFEIGIASCGLDVLVKKVADELGLDFNYVLVNGLEIDEKGILIGKGIRRVELLKKDEALIGLSRKMKIPLDRIIAVGDSKYDIPMLKKAGFGIAFNPGDEKVKRAANAVVEGKNLCGILEHIHF